MKFKSEQDKINHELKRLGFGDLGDPNLIPSIAFFVKDHAQLRGQLFSVLPEKRRQAYEALKPHLRFRAKPLFVYECEMKEMAEKQQLPTYNDKTHQLDPYKPAEIKLK